MKKTTGKVAPKKETVRITLPPKPSAAPTIKLPTLPPGGPTGASSAIPLPSAAKPAAAPAAPRIASAPAAAAAPRATSAPVAPPRKAPAAEPTVGTFDKILAIAAMIASLIAVGTAAFLQWGIPLGN